MRNTKHRPPHSECEIKELIEAGQYFDAQQACDANIDFYEERAAQYRDLYVEVTRCWIARNKKYAEQYFTSEDMS